MEEGVFSIGSDPHEGVFRSMSEAEVSLDEMLSLACRQGKQDIVELLLESGANVNHRNKAGNTPLLEACSQGHVSIARLLLDRNADIDAPTETTYDSALTWACTLGNVEIVRLLLDRKAGVEHRTKDGCTALMFAALAGHEKVAKLLLDHQAEINVESDSNKDSPLTFACWKGHQKVVELFLERSADIEHRTKEGFSPLMFAALGGHTQVAELLLKHHAKVNNPSGSNNDIPLTSACWKGHQQVVYLLLQHDSDIEHRTKDGCTPLMLAAREGHLSVAKLLLNHGANVNMPSGSENNIPLTLACWKGHRDVVNLLLKNVSNIEHQNKAGCTPLMLAAREGHQEATRLLLDSGAQINVPSGSNDDTPLTLACWKGHEEVVSLLIERNSNVNHQTKTGCTPLMEATREGHVGVAKLLLEAGADVETPDNYGQSPFFMACWKGHADVAALLLEYDANKDCRTKTGITPLFQACRENHVDVVKLLLDYGCNPSTPFPNSRECPLTLAAEKGYVELTQLLLLRSAHVEARTKKGCSPLYLACREGYKEIAVMLAKHGASTEAADLRGTTPLLAAYKNGHFEVVEWLLAHVAHLPSDPECNKALLAPMPSDTDLGPQRSKCIELIMKAKKAREQAALQHAQSLFDQLDAEKEKKESRRKAAAKKRDKRKKKKRAGKTDAMEAEKEEDLGVLEDGREGPDGEEGEGSGTPPQPPPSPEFVTSGEVSAMTAPSANSHHLQKKRNRSKKSGKLGSPEAALPLPPDDGSASDSGAEYHDALPDFSPTEPPDHHKDKQFSPLHPPSRPTATHSEQHPYSSHDSKLHPPSSRTDMSTTRHAEQASKRSPQPKAEVSSSMTSKGSSRGNDTAMSSSSAERNRNDQVRGNQGAGLESAPAGGGAEKKRPKIARKAEWNNQKNRSRDVGVVKTPPPSGCDVGVVKTPSPTTAHVSSATPRLPPHATAPVSTRVSPPTSSTTTSRAASTRGASPTAPMATRGVASDTTVLKPETSESKTTQSHSNRGKKQSSSRGHRLSHTPLETSHRHPRDPSPSSSSVGSSTHENSFSSSTKTSADSGWAKPIYSNSPSDKPLHSTTTTTTPPTSDNPSTNQKPGLENKEDFLWSASQESDTGDWGNDVDLEDQLLWSSSTDDDKIIYRSRKLKAAQQTTPTTRPSATSAHPTPTANTSSSSTTYISSQSWQEVTRPTRTVQLTVSNSLVGRIIGRGGSKINTIQVSSGAHINVSRNIPKSTERLITIKGTQRSVSKAQELIDEALSTPDSTVEISAPSTDRGSKISPAPSVLGESPSSTGPTAPPTRRYSEVVPPKHSHVAPTTAVSTASGGKRPLLASKELVKPVSTAGVTSVSDTHTVAVSAVSAPRAGTNAWTNTSSTFASITAVTPSPTLQVSASTSPTLEEHTLTGVRSPPPHTPSLVDSDEDRVLSPAQPSLPSPVEVGRTVASQPSLPSPVEAGRAVPSPVDVGISPVEKTVSQERMVDMNTEFPPLTTPHSRSKSDPQVSTLAPAKVKVQDPPDVRVASEAPPHTSPTPTSSEDTMLTSAPSSSDKLPFVASPPKSPPAKEEGGKGEGATESHAPKTTVDVGVVSSLPMGGHPSNPPSNQQQTSLADKSLPPASQSSSTPDLTSIPAPPSSTASRGGSYGAIGQPTRRSSLPSPPVRGVARKSSYAGYLATLENVRENDPLTSTANNFAPPLNSASGGWPNERRRSTGQHPFVPQNGPFLQQNPPFKGPSNPSQGHVQSDDSLGAPVTPDTPHGENHPLNDQDFTGLGGVYGAIGSNMPSSSGPPSSVGMRPSYNHSPLSSPRLPHPPPLPPNVHPADIWIPPYQQGHRMHHVAQVIPSPQAFRIPPFPSHHAPFRGMPAPKPSLDSAHMMQRANMPHQQRPGDGHVGMRHNMGSDSNTYGVGNGAPAYHKRWSVPSYPQGGGYPPHQGQGVDLQQQQHWGAAGGWPKQGGAPPMRTKTVGGNVNGQYSGLGENKTRGNKIAGGVGGLPMNDPWASHWTTPGGPGFPTPPPPPPPQQGHYNGLPLPTTSQGPRDKTSKPKTGRSVSCVTEPWNALSREIGLEVGGTSGGGQFERRPASTDLLNLMKSLDIGSEHMQSLKARKLSLQQLHSMSEEEWRSLKLPVGPRVKLMNAISHIHQSKGDASSQSLDNQTSEPSTFPAENPALAS